mgnify:CR=1 FL=1
MSCIFCDLIQGAAEVSVCYEDAEAIAFIGEPFRSGSYAGVYVPYEVRIGDRGAVRKANLVEHF